MKGRTPKPHGENACIPDPAKPKPITYTDHRGRVWTATWLRKTIDALGECRPCDAQYRGFAYHDVRLVYRIQQGDERSDDPETVRRHFERARRVTKTFADVYAAAAHGTGTRMKDRIQDLYDERRGMSLR